MKITTVTRTISGDSYDNISATAELKGKDTIESVAIELDSQLKGALEKIREKAIRDFQEHSGHSELPF